MSDFHQLLCTAFAGHRRLASGPLPEVALVVKRATESRPTDRILIYDDATGRDIDINTTGSDEEVIARLTPAVSGASQSHPSGSKFAPASDSPPPIGRSEPLEAPRSRGRPRLGVVGREITLLPRHWDWLNAQSGGASVAVRKLVEAARRTNAGKDRSRQARDAAYHFMSSMAGDFPGFEEAARALFSGDQQRFVDLISTWPHDVRTHAIALAADFAKEPAGQTSA